MKLREKNLDKNLVALFLPMKSDCLMAWKLNREKKVNNKFYYLHTLPQVKNWHL